MVKAAVLRWIFASYVGDIINKIEKGSKVL